MTIPEDQFNESEVTARLFELITNMPEHERIKLLEKVEEWQLANKRKHPRKSYLMSADYIINDKNGEAFNT